MQNDDLDSRKIAQLYNKQTTSTTEGGKPKVCNKKPHFIKGRFGGNVNIIAKGDSSSQNIVTWLINKKKPSRNDLA